MDDDQTYSPLKRPEPGKAAKIIKITNLVVGYSLILCSLVIIGFGVLAMLTMLPKLVGLQFFMVLSPAFMILLGIIQICVEWKVQFVLENFTFMNSLAGKGFFMLFLSSVMYCMLTVSQFSSVTNFLICSPLLIIGLIYTFLAFCYCGKSGYGAQLKENLV